MRLNYYGNILAEAGTPIAYAYCMKKTRLFYSHLWFALLAPASLIACMDAPETEAPLGDDYIDIGKGDAPVSERVDRLHDIPFYFGVGIDSVTTPLNRPAYPYPTLWNKSLEADNIGLRMIAVNQGTGLEARRAARREMAQKLAAAGVLQDGDIALTFRPELANTKAYPHIQMGATHAGLVFTKNGQAYNIDSPLDKSYIGQFDAPHYAGDGGADGGTGALHILRSKKMDERRRANFRGWVDKLVSALPRINGERAQVKFQSDYMVPAFVARQVSTQVTVTLLGKIILEQDRDAKLPMYCSEFAWHMLALSNCTAEEIRNAPAEGAACVDPVFAPMPLIGDERAPGLAEGPLMATMELPADKRATAVATVFTEGDAARLSAGHRAVAEQVAPLMSALSQYFTARASGVSAAQLSENASALNAQVPANYSPTAFLVNAMGPRETRAMDYVTTVTFVGAAGYARAKILARQPSP